MRFLGLFRKQKPAEKPAEEFEIQVSGIADFYRKRLGSRAEEARSKILGMRASLVSSLSSLPLDSLEKASFEGDDHRYAAVNMAKASYVTRVKSIVSGLKAQGDSYKDMEEFKGLFSRALEDIKNTSPKQSLAISNFFRKETGEVVEKLKKAEQDLEAFNSFLLSEGKPFRLMDILDSWNRQYAEALGKKAEIGRRKDALAKEERLLQSEESGLKRSLDALLKSRDWQEMELAEDRARKLESEASQSSYRISGELAFLKRPLKKAKHASGKEGIFQSFISDPLGSFLSEGGDRKLAEILSSFGSLQSEGKVTLKEKEAEKLSSFRQRIEGMGSLREGHLSLIKKLESAREKIDHSLPERKASLERRMDVLKESLRLLKNEARSLEVSRQKAEEEIASRISHLEGEIMKNAGDKVRLV